MDNLGQFLRKYARVYHECTAYEMKRGFRTEIWRYADVYSLALKTATFLQTCRLTKGDTIVIWSSNMPEYAILYFACWLLGIVVVPIDVRTTTETLQRFVTAAGCILGFKSKFVSADFPDSVTQTYVLEDLMELVQLCPQLEYFPAVFPADLAEIAFTSGTTGIPKGVPLTHHNFLAAVSALCLTFPFQKGYRMLSLLPLSHTFEQVVDFLAVFQTGNTVVYLERLNQVTILRALQYHRITSVAIVPQLLQLLLFGMEREIKKSGKQRIWSVLHMFAPFLSRSIRRGLFFPVRRRLGEQLQFFGCGSASLNSKLARTWERMGIAIYEGYGATETTAVVSINTPSAKRLGSVGKPLPGVHVRIDPATHEIVVHGPNVAAGYFHDCQKTQQFFAHGWYRTGDIGTFDSDGYLYITGRESMRIVLASGEKVYPEDIENHLNAQPLVRESCVVGVKRAEGERVHAVVIINDPSKLDEVIQHVNRELSSHEQILEWSVWKQADFPRTPLLKVDRKIVAETIEGSRERKQEVVHVAEQDKLLALIAHVAHRSIAQIRETDSLTTNLALDSLQRVELLSFIEQEFGVALLETRITEHTTVAQLRELIRNAEVVSEEIPLHSFNYTPFIANVRVFLQNILVFPLHALFVPLQMIGQEHLADVELPAIFYFNHIGIMDAVCALRVLPAAIRKKLVIAALRDLWTEWRQLFVEFFGGGFPFDPRQQIKASLEQTGAFLDRQFSIMIAPEGAISRDGTLQPFKSGVGFMAVHMHVPVVPIKIDPAYRDIFPPMEGSILENVPKRRKRIWVKIGQPMRFSMQSSIEQATADMRRAMEEL
jgi:long-chain acyl-CoA synthetase